MLKLYDIDFNYVNYLRMFDKNIADPKENARFGRKYIGVILNFNNYKYFAPLTSKVWKYNDVNGQIQYVLDNNGNKILKNRFSEIYIKNRNGEYIAAVKINNMFPLPKGKEHLVSNVLNISTYQNSLNTEERKYAALLLDESNYINLNEIEAKILSMANKFHRDYRFNNVIKSVSCDFKLLEVKSDEYFNNIKN